MLHNFFIRHTDNSEQGLSIEKAEKTLEISQRSLKQSASGTQAAAFELISDLKTAVERREKKYQILVENIQDGMYILRNKEFIFANKALCNIIGKSRKEIIGKTLKEIVNVTNHYSAMIGTNGSGHREYTINYTTDDGINKVVTVWETLSYDADFAIEIGCKKVNALKHDCMIAIGTVKDVTNDIEKERMLKVFSSSINNSSDVMMVVSNLGNIMFVNTAFEDTYGYALHEVAGKNPNLLKSSIHGEDFYKRMWDTLLSGQEWHGVIFNKAKDGHIIEDETRIIPFMNGNNTPMFFMAIKKIHRVYNSVEAADILHWNNGKPDKP